jgi:precorrin-2 dehydrogenase / sirohydrochlorin ferrochelatase
MKNQLFPIFLKLDQLNTLVVGGGAVGLEKIEGILRNSPGANITLVAPQIKPEIYGLAVIYPHVILIEREFHNQDLAGRDLVILATNDRELNKEIKLKTSELKILTNVADTPDICDFYLGSVVTKGDLKIAISTNGQSPTFAKRLRQLLEDVLPEELPELLLNLKKVRDRLKGDFQYKVHKLNELTASLIGNHER